MEFRIKFKVSMVLAVRVLAEIASVIWYNQSHWYGRYGNRYFLTSIVADAILVVLLKWITENFWAVRRWQDGAILSMWLSLVFTCLQAPHEMSLSNDSHVASFMFHVLHKFVLMSVMTASLFYFDKY